MDTTTPTLLIAPTEPVVLRGLGTTSGLPERFGVDVLWQAGTARWGVQRKELNDLVASLRDGRLAKELGQMQPLEQAVLLVEGRPQWTNDGRLFGSWGAGFSRAQLYGVAWSVQAAGVWWVTTNDLHDTMETLLCLSRWSIKERHGSLTGRPGPSRTAWGTVSNRAFQTHLLTGFPGVGPVLAERIVQRFGGVPLSWTVTTEQLMEVEGMGKVKAERLVRALRSAAADTATVDMAQPA